MGQCCASAYFKGKERQALGRARTWRHRASEAPLSVRVWAELCGQCGGWRVSLWGQRKLRVLRGFAMAVGLKCPYRLKGIR